MASKDIDKDIKSDRRFALTNTYLNVSFLIVWLILFSICIIEKIEDGIIISFIGIITSSIFINQVKHNVFKSSPDKRGLGGGPHSDSVWEDKPLK